MDRIHIFSIFLTVVFLLSCQGGVLAEDKEAAAAQVEVTGVSISPGVLMPYDTAIVSITMNNTGTEAVSISHAMVYSDDLKVISDNYEKVGSIGAKNSLTLDFTIQARGETGIFYPVLSLDFRGAHFLRYPFKVTVLNYKPEMSVVSKPEIFVEGKKDIIYLHIGNPRDNIINAVTISATGKGHEIVPESYFIGTMSQDNVVDIPINITPYGNETINFTLTWQNGVNIHTLNRTLPITLGKSRKQANPVLSNVVVNNEDGIFKVTGDVTNSGLETANGVEVSSEYPAHPVFPYKLYAVGALKPDDFSSFEVTFKVENTTEVPLVTSFKDKDGNIFRTETLLEVATHIDDSTVPVQQSGSLPLPNGMMIYMIPAIALILVIAGILYGRKNE